jgi:hypothetical protein
MNCQKIGENSTTMFLNGFTMPICEKWTRLVSMKSLTCHKLRVTRERRWTRPRKQQEEQAAASVADELAGTFSPLISVLSLTEYVPSMISLYQL